MATNERRGAVWFLAGAVVVLAGAASRAVPPQRTILDPTKFAHFVQVFNAADEGAVVNLIPNAQAWQWIVDNAPLFDCPSPEFTRIYYFRWWTYRKHIRQTPTGRVLTEFLEPVSHAGPHNTISCAFGHHIAEGRWLRDQSLLDEYAHFWFRSEPDRRPADHLHNFSSWAAAALYDRYLVTGDAAFLIDLLDDLVADFKAWQRERRRADCLYWQYDVRDGMEESISGSRTRKHIRPTINSYMAANARAIAHIATLAGRTELAREFGAAADALRENLIASLWDPESKFFKVRFEDGGLSAAREAIGYIPWMFDLAGSEHAEAWRQLQDPDGFSAPWGLTTAERRHPAFRSHGAGTCEWDGAVWPFATSQTLTGLAKLLHGPAQPYVTGRSFFEQMIKYARSHQRDGEPYIGEYLDETTGDWLITGPKADRSRYYNHSTFNDLVICGLVGLVPRDGDVIEVDPLIPADTWDWFCLDGVPYHGQSLSIVWDRTGRHYGRGAGLAVWINGSEVVRSPKLQRVLAPMPAPNALP